MSSGMRVLEGEYIDGDSGDPDLDQAFANFRDSLNAAEMAEGTISAYRIPTDKLGNPIAKTARQSWLFTVPIGSVTLLDIIARIKSEFMREGETFCMVRLTGHRPGKRGNEFNQIHRIEKENEPPKTAPTPGQTDVAGLMRAMQDMMQAGQARTDAMMKQMMDMQLEMAKLRMMPPQAAPAQNADPMAFMERMLMMQATMKRLESVFNPASAAPALAANADPFAQLFAAMRTMKQMQGLMGGDAPKETEDDSLLGNLTKLATPLVGLMTENERTKRAMIERGIVPRKRRASLPPAPASPVGAVATAPVVAPESVEEPGEPDMNLTETREMLKSLCEMAAEGTPASDAAAIIMDQIPEEHDDQIGELVAEENKGGFLGRISTLYAGCREHAEWFEQLRQALDASFTADPDQPLN